ncbi:hypothetical protein [Desulfatitalea tepidiphila]|uniref:hypothetical protein n=1 Tax=Desulfatitalea tepidiphila TaxID=1185843 RepID=UPI0006B484A8|nr:hypothetical protein [Desulfatitalea tepidiphila]
MTPIEQHQNIIRELVKVLPVAQPWERGEIQTIIRRRQLRLDMLVLLAELESQPFDPQRSQQIDAINAFLECY